MKLLIRGVTVELPDDDPRAIEVERLVFGAPFVREVPPPPPPPRPPRPDIPARFEKFWVALDRKHRRELALLAGRTWPVTELEKELGLTQAAVRGRHSLVARTAHRFGFKSPIRSLGRLRAQRRFVIDEPTATWVRYLAEETAAEPASRTG